MLFGADRKQNKSAQSGACEASDYNIRSVEYQIKVVNYNILK